MLHDDNSLFYRVFKARFFPNGTILDAKEASSASYAWKSILKGREVIKKGALWRVGDGKQIRIWGDNRLPVKKAVRITTPVMWGQENSSVEVLINPVTKCWRNEVIEHVFNPVEAKMIKAIPLSSSNKVDTLIWPFNPSGHYSVKFGYKFLQECAENSHVPAQESIFWKKVWVLEVPSKVKKFIWRACREALPTRKNLQRRRIVPNGICDLCKAEEEDCSHALFFCSDVHVIWSVEWSWIAALQGHTMKEIFSYAFEEKMDVTLLAFTNWSVWNRRNQLHFKENACPLNQILPLAKERKREFQCLQPTTLRMQHRKHTRWKPPERDYYKVNYDGATFEQQGKASLGVVIRNSNGEVMASMSQLV